MPKKRGYSIKKEVEEVLALEKKELSKESRLEKEEEKEIEELKNLELLEKQIREDVGEHPLTKITIKDIAKGLIGAFVGIVSHFAFVEGANIAAGPDFTYTRATALLIFSFILGLIFMYATGYRKIKEKRLLKLFPLRAIAIYIISLTAIFIAFYLYGITTYTLGSLGLLYKQIAAVSLPAIIGASAADLIGRD